MVSHFIDTLLNEVGIPEPGGLLSAITNHHEWNDLVGATIHEFIAEVHESTDDLDTISQASTCVGRLWPD